VPSFPINIILSPKNTDFKVSYFDFIINFLSENIKNIIETFNGTLIRRIASADFIGQINVNPQ